MENRKAEQSVDRLFSGGSMGALMRAYDWSTSSLGQPDRWPQSLRLALSIMLESPFPMMIAWGEDLIQFYNDAYRPILGASRHPAALGGKASETFAEVWSLIGPLFADAMQGKAISADDQMVVLERNGYPEEGYFTSAYSPIRAENGDVGGVLVIVTETTWRVVAERRLRASSRLAEPPAQAASATSPSGSVPVEPLLDFVPDPVDPPLARLLIVDDNADMRDYLNRLFGGLYEVVLANDGSSALELSRQQPPDLILADVVMPGVDGLELLRTLRSGDHLSAVPLILLSASAEEAMLVAGLQQGADDYVIKPFSARELLARVRSHLELAQLRVETARRERHYLGQLQRVADASLSIHDSRSVGETLDRITRNAREIIGAHMAVTSLAALDDNAQPVLNTSLSDKYADWRSYAGWPDGSSIFGQLVETHRPIRLTETQAREHPEWVGFGTDGVRPPLRGWLAAPMIDRAGHNLGVIQLSDRYNGDFTEEDEAILVQLANLAAVAVENARLYVLESGARAQAEKANALKLQFLAMISHELRTPLASIKGFLSTALADDIVWDAGQLRDFLTIADDEADKLTDLIDQLLDVSRIRAGTFRVHPESQDLTQVISSMLPTLHRLDSEHQLTVNVDRGLPPVCADGERVAQVIYNLIDNAGKYSPPGAPIVLTAHLRHGFAQIDISDQGDGIPADARDTVFEAFRRLDGLSRQRGAGLGLAICKGIIQAHGGRIWIQERAGRGTTVSFTLPLV